MSDPEPQRTRRDRIALRNQGPTRRHWAALGWLVFVLSILAGWVLLPFLTPLLLAAWSAHLAWPVYQKVARGVRQRERAAAVLTVLLVVSMVTPVAIAALSLAGSAIELGKKVLSSESGLEALKALADGGNGTATIDVRNFDLQQWIDLATKHGIQALGAANTLLGVATQVTVGLVVFVAAFYAFLVEGKPLYAWLLDRSPLSRGHSHRLGQAFLETGNGLLIGVGLTALIQGLVAMVGYLLTGVPSALVLGLATAFASLVPSVGSGLVWVPVAAGLAVSGRTGAALVLTAIGCFVATVDNLLRPLLVKYGSLKLHGLVLFLAMLGGLAVFGGSGLILGPLILRLTAEALTIWKEHRAGSVETEEATPQPD
jgi:predicted PurR-regulated permease PerM